MWRGLCLQACGLCRAQHAQRAARHQAAPHRCRPGKLTACKLRVDTLLCFIFKQLQWPTVRSPRSKKLACTPRCLAARLWRSAWAP